MKTCKVLVAKQSGMILAGKVSLQDGKILSVPEPGFEHLMSNVLEWPASDVEGHAIDRHAEPEQWFESLPLQYHGSYLRAVMEQGVSKFNPHHDAKGEFSSADESAQPKYSAEEKDNLAWMASLPGDHYFAAGADGKLKYQIGVPPKDYDEKALLSEHGIQADKQVPAKAPDLSTALKGWMEQPKAIPSPVLNAIDMMAARGLSPSSLPEGKFVIRVGGLSKEDEAADATGVYDDDRKEINLARSMDPKIGADTFIHEFGHLLDFNSKGLGPLVPKLLDEYDKARTDFMRQTGMSEGVVDVGGARNSHVPHAPSGYAISDPHEWVAEAFRVYMVSGMKNKDWPATTKYVDSLIRGPRAH